MDKPTRIKYTLTDNKYVSNQNFLGNEGVLLTGIIEPGRGKAGVYKYSNVTTTIESEPCLVLIEEVDYEKFTEAKVIVKTLLKKYGVEFFEETRNKKGSDNA